MDNDATSPSYLNKSKPREHCGNRSCCNTRKALTGTHEIRPGNSERDKLLDGRIGHVEYPILEYAVTQAESFTPRMIVNYVWKKYGLKLDSRRVYDAIKRLVKRNILLKIDRGWYTLNPELNLSQKDLERIALKVKSKLVPENAEVNSSDQCRNVKENGWGPREWVRDPVARVHVSCSGPVDLLYLYFVLVMALEILKLVIGCLYNYLRQLGYSIRKLRKVKQEAKGYVENVVGCVIGGRSLYGGGESKALIPVQKLEKATYRELGVDLILGVDRAPKIHVKIYTTGNPYKHQSLTEYMKLGENEA